MSHLWFTSRLGPLTTSWCMRMEAKNSYFKRVAQQGNFKNIALSVARRHQKLMCALLQSDDFFEKAMVKSKGMRVINAYITIAHYSIIPMLKHI